jgi:hypothetical protein
MDFPQELREKLDASWRSHTETLASRLFGEWRSEVERFFAQQLDEQRSAHLRVVERLNQTVRSLRRAESHADWILALLDAATESCPRAALFTALNQRLRCEGTRGFAGEPLDGLDIPLASAPAFAGCVETGDPAVALASASELSETVAERLGGETAHLFPIECGGKVVAVLLAEAEAQSGAAGLLGALASIAGSTLENRMAAASASGLVPLFAVAPAGRKDWASLPREERQLHLKAQRLARLRASQLRVEKAVAVTDGRARRDLYAALTEDIDSAREEFRREFMDASPDMVDYLHLELVRTLANEDSGLLGPQYPGPLV